MKLKYKLIAFSFSILLISCKKEPKNTKISGPVFGTSYSIIYDVDTNFGKQIDSLYYVINKSMSTYQTNSDISKLNRNESNKIDLHFKKVLEVSKQIYSQTEGVFDPTIGTIVNALGFGPEKKIERLDSLKIDSLMQFVGLKNIDIADQIIIKKYKNTFIDFNAIAKGYAVDVVADFLESKNVTNYLVEIGGEIRAKGKNIEKNAAWTVGIDKPNFDGTQSVLKAITLQESAMATSGTYRKFKLDENGKRYAHIIDAKTGYPSKSNILGVSVVATSCIQADAYATAFQAMGIEKTKSFLKNHSELKVFIVFENNNNELETLSLNGFPEA
ncbi:FAD:protein FMN transferase [Oceanihabitans sp. 2_MG-2023]|uniref:FAD:protein FMN transferase n=1 Tax=Oceanihabitans sp. 2_MG-2023 TaxID=3062661 RepID=UPI0026E3BDCE|nr:FAD:protein FMN transferase [Oceanihabitans sp. 2_MG-2023]MDO6598427.1 FAD:protein FMN transferase [Oceanihabitans sp. 2_MG-2023]